MPPEHSANVCTHVKRYAQFDLMRHTVVRWLPSTNHRHFSIRAASQYCAKRCMSAHLR